MPSRSEWLVVACMALGLFALGRWSIEHRPDEVYTEQFLFNDDGFNLLLAKNLLTGKALYRDAASAYGPIGVYLTVGAAAVFGNTMATYVGLSQVVHLLAFLLTYAALRRAVSRTTALLVVLLGLAPCMLFPIALLGQYLWGLYLPLERCCLAGLALAWAPPQTRTVRQAVVIGSILGLMQGVKFGGAAFAGAALLALDLLAFRSGGPTPFRTAALAVMRTFAVFLLWEVGWVAAALLTLPPTIARDVVWPVYFLTTYADHQGSVLPDWRGTPFFLQQQFTPLFGLILGLVGLGAAIWQAQGRSGDAPRLRPLFFTLFFLFGCLGYFRHQDLTYQHIWTGAAGSAWLLERVGPLPRTALSLFWVPGVVVVFKSLAAPLSDARTAVEVPTTHEIVYVERQMAANLPLLDAELQRQAKMRGDLAPKAVVLRIGAGFNFFYGTEPPLRNLWFVAGMFRPYDDEELTAKVSELTAVVLIGVPQGVTADQIRDPEGWGKRQFSPAAREAFRQHLGTPVQVGEGWWVLPIRGKSGSAQE